MATWEELEQKYSQRPPSAPTSDSPWSALEEKYAAPKTTATQAAKAESATKEPQEVSLLDKFRAGAAGVNKGFYSDLIGLPVDTAANILDLGKAAIGYTTSKVTGKAPPAWTEPYDRRTVPGTAEWIAQKINQGGLGGAINNPNPDDAPSRVLYSGGRVAGSSIVPDPRAKISGLRQIGNMAMGGVGGLSSGVAGEFLPDWAGVAGMIPSVAAATTAAGTKRAIRGNEAGRQEMAQRIQDLKNSGVDEPSAGLASGNKLVMGLENLLAQTPFSSDMYQTRAQQNIAGMQNKTNALRDAISTEFGPVAAGQAIQSDLAGPFRDRINATTRALNDRVGDQVGSDFFTYPENSLATSRSMSTPIPGAKATSESLINPRIAEIAKNLASDVLGTPIYGSSVTNAPTQYRRFDGAVSDTPPGIPFGTLKNLRTDIGAEAGSNAIMGTPEQAKFKRLYGAMSDDMRQAVNAADRAKSGVDVGPLQMDQQPGAVALNRANNFYSKAMDRTEDLNGLANRSTPEGAYNAVANSLNSGPTLYERLRGAITPDSRQKIVSTIIDEMGTATPGQQGAAGDSWSPRTFLTNYAKLHENGGGDALFKRLPGGEKHAENLADIAKAAEMVGDASKVWANPSGTAPALTARGTLGALTVGAFLQPMVAAGTAGGLLVGNQVSQRLLLNPKFVNWLAKAKEVRPQDAQAYAQRLIATAKMTNDKQFKQDVADYLDAVPAYQNNP